MWRAYTEVIHCAFDQIPTLQNCFTTPNKYLGGEGASDGKSFAGKFLRKDDIKGLVSLKLFIPR
jgi:hypothetical protein